MSASVAFSNTSSTSSFVTPCWAQCCTLPSGSSSRSQIIESNAMYRLPALWYYSTTPGTRRQPCRVARSSLPFRLLPREVQVLGDSGSILPKRFREQADAPFCLRQVVVLKVDVEQVDVPRQFDIVHDVVFDDLPCDGQRRGLRRVVNVAVAGSAELFVFSGEEPPVQLRRELVTRL